MQYADVDWWRDPLCMIPSLLWSQSPCELGQDVGRGHVIRTRSHSGVGQTSPWLPASARRPQGTRPPPAGLPLSERHAHWLASVEHCCKGQQGQHCDKVQRTSATCQHEIHKVANLWIITLNRSGDILHFSYCQQNPCADQWLYINYRRALQSEAKTSRSLLIAAV